MDEYELWETDWGMDPALQWTWLTPYWVAKLRELGIVLAVQLDFFGESQYVGLAIPFSDN